MKIFRPADFGVGVHIVATGIGTAARSIDNAALVAMGAPLTAEEIVRLSGILQRQWVSESQATSDLAVDAAVQALAGIDRVALDRLIVATVSPDHSSPSCACVVHKKLGLPPLPVFDVTASCSGFVYALDLGARAIATGDAHVLIVAADVRSRFIDITDRSTCALFGDGAGAALLARGEVGTGITAIGLVADGAGSEAVYVPAGGSREPASAASVAARRHTIRMAEGPQVYFTAVDGMLKASEALLSACGLAFSDIDLVVPHQPNRRILDRFAKLGGIASEKMFINVDRHGNMSGASCAVALHEAIAEGRDFRRALLVTAGAGYTAGVALYER